MDQLTPTPTPTLNPTTEKKDMSQFRYSNSHDIPIAEATRLVKAWANRRGYPCELVSITDREVIVSIFALNSKEHNRSVTSLSRILDRCVNRAEWNRNQGPAQP